MPTIQAPDRQQLTFMNKLDDMVAPDHPVRALDALVDRIINTDPAFFDHLEADQTVGRRGFSAGCLIKLLLYGYIEGIRSSRKLQTEAERNIELIWLLSGLAPSYKVIADYRTDYPARIERVNREMVAFLTDNGCIDGERVAVDGTKLKAYTGWDMPDEEALEKRLATAHEQLEDWLERLQVNDALDDAEQTLQGMTDGPSASEPELMAQIDRLHRRIEQLEAAKGRLAASEASRLPLSDPEARSMRASHGGKPPSYNLQAAVDGRNKMIVVAEVTNDPTDFEQLLPMHEATSQRLGSAPKELLADTGYADLGDIKQLQTHTSTRCYIPENDAPVKNRSVQFTYQPEEDRYRCSAGRYLEPKSKGRYRKSKDAYVDMYRGTSCPGCPLQAECTSAADGVRTLSVFHGAPWRDRYARQIGSRYGKARIRERKGIVEHVFGTLKYWMGQIPLTLRGLRKVQTEINLYATGYNIKRYTSLAPVRELIREIKNWNPTSAAPAA